MIGEVMSGRFSAVEFKRVSGPGSTRKEIAFMATAVKTTYRQLRARLAQRRGQHLFNLLPPASKQRPPSEAASHHLAPRSYDGVDARLTGSICRVFAKGHVCADGGLEREFNRFPPRGG
jgi:hypothetical protein